MFGGSGAMGQRVVSAAAARRWGVTGLVRRPGTLDPEGLGATEIVGEFATKQQIARTMEGADAVVTVIGPRTGSVAIGADVEVGLLSSISRSDLAEVLLDLCVDSSTVGKTLFVKAR